MRWTHFFEYYSLLNQTKDEIEFCIAQYHLKFEVVVKNIPTGKKKSFMARWFYWEILLNI